MLIWSLLRLTPITQQYLMVVGLGQDHTVSSVQQCQISSRSTHTCMERNVVGRLLRWSTIV